MSYPPNDFSIQLDPDESAFTDLARDLAFPKMDAHAPNTANDQGPSTTDLSPPSIQGVDPPPDFKQDFFSMGLPDR